MNYAFDVALNRIAASRDFAAFVGDEFAVAVTFYDEDGDTTVSDLTGDTATLEVLRCGDVEITVTGVVASGVATFDFADVDVSDIPGRNVFRVKLVRDGLSSTVISGAFTVSE